MSTDRYTIAILGGTGAEGSGIGLRLARAGHHVVIGSRNPEKAVRVCEDLASSLAPGQKIVHADNRSAAASAQIIILTVPHAAQRMTVEEVRDALAGKILVDATVPLVPPKVARVQLPEGGSAVAAIQKLLGDSVRVVSAFQNVAAHQLRDVGHEVDCDVLVCGDDVAGRVAGLRTAGQGEQECGESGEHDAPRCDGVGRSRDRLPQGRRTTAGVLTARSGAKKRGVKRSGARDSAGDSHTPLFPCPCLE
jgi:hypothetical protein